MDLPAALERANVSLQVSSLIFTWDRPRISRKSAGK